MSTPHPPLDPMQQAQQLFAGHHPWLLSRLKARLRNTAEAQDVASETFLRVVAAPQPLRIDEPRAFLTTIAQRLLFTLWRRRELERAYLEALAQRQDALAPSPEERALLLETLETIAQALDGLPLKARQTFLLSQLDGLTYHAIAEQLGISHSTVRRHMTEAFRRIAIAQLQQQAGISRVAPMPSRALTPLDSATEAAIGWLVQLHSGDMGESERYRLAQWLDADPQHRSAWEQLQAPLQQLRVPQPAASPSAGSLLSDTLARAEARTRKRRQVLRGALGLGGMAVGATWLADRHQPVLQWSADLRTGTGERREFLLPDGSRLTLDARSAVDLDFRPGHRRVRLRQGALLAEATPQADHGPAFTVHTVHGQVQALGTRFTVRLQEADSLVGMLEHSVEITTASGQQRQLHEGHSARFSATQIEDADALSPEGAAAWRHGMLQVHDQPLADVVQALRAYRPGVVRIAPRAAALQVYGTYALDDTDRALTALAETLPITVRRSLGGWLVVIE